MKKIISASRRTDLVASYPDWFSVSIKEEHARIYGPSGHTYTVDLSPQSVHTMVLWSKNFVNLIENRFDLRERLKKYSQLYLHFTITGLGGTSIEQAVPKPESALGQLDALLEIVENPERISIRFDPVIYWEHESKRQTNLRYFGELSPELNARGIKNVRFSFAQWYGKARRRAAKQGFKYIDPSDGEKRKDAEYLVSVAKTYNLNLFACSQDFLTVIPGVNPSSCIDGGLLQKLHPRKEPVSKRKDKTQRQHCLCTDSVDIGSYTQFCPHCCLYCYANPKI
jgi:DNA repair photolyase